MLTAKSAIPLIKKGNVLWSRFDKTAIDGISIFTSSPGYLADEGLAEALIEDNRPILWLRLGHEDEDPATLLLSLIESARHLKPEIGKTTLEKMKLNPGPLMGWSGLYKLLAQELTDAFTVTSVIVLENIDLLNTTPHTSLLLRDQFLVHFPPTISQILTSNQPVPSLKQVQQAKQYGNLDLKIGYETLSLLAEAYQSNLSIECLQKIIKLFDGRGVVLAGILEICQDFGIDFMKDIIYRSKNINQLLTSIVQARIAGAGMEEISALLLSFRLGYCHPELSHVAFGQPVIPLGPWMQSLSNGWFRLRKIWGKPILDALGQEGRLAREARLLPVAEFLSHHGAVGKAVEISLVQKSYSLAAQLITKTVDEMMDLGQWFTLEGWFNKLPDGVIRAYPKLIYAQGEIAAVNRCFTDARRLFNLSTSLFYNRGENAEACKSMLAESTIASWEGEDNQARTFARAAESLARQSGLTDQLTYAIWYLTSFAASSNTLGEALDFLKQVREDLIDPFLSALFHKTRDLINNQIRLQSKRNSLYQEYLLTSKTVRENLDSLQRLIGSPPSNLEDVFIGRGWSNTPLIMKIPTRNPLLEIVKFRQKPSFLKRIFQFLSRIKSKKPPSESDELVAQSKEIDSTVGWIIQPQLLSQMIQNPESEPQSIPPNKSDQQSMGSLRNEVEKSLSAAEPDQPNDQAKHPDISQPLESDLSRREETLETTPPPNIINGGKDSTLSIIVYCLGSFRVYQDDKEVAEWNSYKARDIFKYLLAHPNKSIAKDILIETFWPETDPKAGRRNLHQAIYSLRQTLRGDQPEFHHIWFENDTYFLNPDMDLWLDFQEFERCINTGRQFEKAGRHDEAIQQYATAEQLYQGDFLQDDLYEDWPILQREFLLNTYMNLVERLSTLYINNHQFASVVPICQKVITKDRTHETAHRLLMQCYTSQGLRHLAVRQYQTCIKALREELDISPSEETIALYDCILKKCD